MDLKGDQVPVVFAMNGATAMARGIEAWVDAHWLPGFRLAEKEERRRHDRESYIRSKINVRGRKVYLIDSFATDPDEAVDEKVWGTILFVSSLKDASCADVTLIGTMFPYMRQDQKDQPRAAINTATFVRQMWAAGVQRLITIDVHNPAAVQNAAAALKMNFDHLEARCPLTRAPSVRQTIDGIWLISTASVPLRAGAGGARDAPRLTMATMVLPTGGGDTRSMASIGARPTIFP